MKLIKLLKLLFGVTGLTRARTLSQAYIRLIQLLHHEIAYNNFTGQLARTSVFAELPNPKTWFEDFSFLHSQSILSTCLSIIHGQTQYPSLQLKSALLLDTPQCLTQIVFMNLRGSVSSVEMHIFIRVGSRYKRRLRTSRVHVYIIYIERSLTSSVDCNFKSRLSSVLKVGYRNHVYKKSYLTKLILIKNFCDFRKCAPPFCIL